MSLGGTQDLFSLRGGTRTEKGWEPLIYPIDVVNHPMDEHCKKTQAKVGVT